MIFGVFEPRLSDAGQRPGQGAGLCGLSGDESKRVVCLALCCTDSGCVRDPAIFHAAQAERDGTI